MIVPIGREKTKMILAERGVVAIVGMYGSGKSLVANWLASEGRWGKVVRVNLKDLPNPSEEDIPQICGYRSWAQLHTGWRKLAELVGKRGKKLLIMIEEAQKLVEGGAKLWEILFSLRYYQAKDVRVVLTAQPLILEASDVILQRLLRGNVVYPRQLTLAETSEYLAGSKHARQVQRLAHGHYGTVKYLAQFLRETKFEGEKLTERRIEQWARKRGEMNYFVQTVWKGLGRGQQRLVRQYVLGKGIKKGQEEELVECGVLWKGGGKMKWCVPWTLPFVHEYLAGLKEELGMEELTNVKWGKLERVVWTMLWERRGRTVTYDQLGDVVWGEGAEFSLWALSRLVGRVQNKLRQIGCGSLIENVRGAGYRARVV